MDVCLPSPKDPFLGVGEQLFSSWDGKANVEVSETIWAEEWTYLLCLGLSERRSPELAIDLGDGLK